MWLTQRGPKCSHTTRSTALIDSVIKQTDMVYRSLEKPKSTSGAFGLTIHFSLPEFLGESHFPFFVEAKEIQDLKPQPLLRYKPEN